MNHGEWQEPISAENSLNAFKFVFKRQALHSLWKKNVWPSSCLPLTLSNCLLLQRKWCQTLELITKLTTHTAQELTYTLSNGAHTNTLPPHTHNIVFPCIILNSAHHSISCNTTPLSPREVESEQGGAVAVHTQ